MKMRRVAMAVVLPGLFFAGCTLAQTPPAPEGQASSSDVTASPGQPSLRAPEAPIDGLVRVDKGTLAVTLPDDNSKKLLLYDFEFEGAPVATDKLHLKQLSPGVFEITSVAYTVGEWRVRVRDSAEYYGLGEHFDTLNHAHTVVRNVSQDVPGTKGSSTYKPIPFFMSTTGYGVWFDTTGDATFDMNAASKEDIIVDADAEKLRIVLFAQREFPKILDSFTAMAGRSILPPYWAFAPWLGRDYHQNDEQVRQDADKARELGLPASVILIDSPWATGYNSYRFNPKQFADAPAMVKHLHDEGYKLVLWHTPWINVKSDPPGEQGFAGKIDVTSSNYAEAAALGFFVKNPDGTPYLGRWWKGQGSLIDFTNPHAKLWWQNQVRQAIQAGADGFKDDDAEGSFIGEVKFADESDPRIMRNRYAVLYNNAMEELIQNDLKGNGVLFIRSATTGANGLGFLWGGDNQASFSPENGLPTVVTAGLGAGLSGMPLWTADLGGYEQTATTPDPRLFMRWTEYAAFSPVMEVISTSNLLPWDYKDQALEVYRKFSKLNMSLFPYRYAAAQEAAKTGMPIKRALVLEHQDDEQARLARNEYMFGPALLVAPIVDEGTQRTIYLPQGEWVDYWTGAHLAGGTTIVAEAPVDSIPLYLKQGAVLPKLPDDVMTLVPASESGNQQIRTMDDRRVYELTGEGASSPVTLVDFEGRRIVRSGNTISIAGDSAAHIIVRWRFLKVQRASVGGAAVKLQSDANGQFIEFDHMKHTTVTWE
jgi:alpha-D-xyloside xylohydrolase